MTDFSRGLFVTNFASEHRTFFEKNKNKFFDVHRTKIFFFIFFRKKVLKFTMNMKLFFRFFCFSKSHIYIQKMNFFVFFLFKILIFDDQILIGKKILVLFFFLDGT